jgi:transposase
MTEEQKNPEHTREPRKRATKHQIKLALKLLREGMRPVKVEQITQVSRATIWRMSKTIRVRKPKVEAPQTKSPMAAFTEEVVEEVLRRLEDRIQIRFK